MSTRFVLVHGGMHTAAHFDLLAAELRAGGNEVVAPDLPGRGERADERATWEGCRAAVADVIEADDVIVCHSAGGYASTLAAEVTAPLLRRMIFLAAAVPADGEKMALARALEMGSPLFTVREGRWGPEAGASSFEVARETFYQDCDEALARQAYEGLVPELVSLATEPIPLPTFHDLAIPRDYLVCLDDRSGINARVPGYLELLGLSRVHVMWSSHSPFLSQPEVLARRLVSIATSSA